jgi:dTDP-4-dehydrorhamnose reductase
MKILITGANGYIGKSLYNAFKDKYEVSKLTRDICDLTNSESVNQYFKDKHFDIILHCAVEGGSRLKEDSNNVLDNNLKMYYNLIHNENHFKKLIHLGSGAELTAQDTPYGLSKHVIRQSILKKDNFYNIRIYGVFDENELDTRFIKANIKRYINKQPMEIHQDKFMDFFYMKDLVTLVEDYILNEAPKEINCSYKDICTLLYIANFINDLDEHKVEIIQKEKGFGSGYYGTHHIPKISYIGLKQGIKEVYNKLKNEY